jgi:hypothetical protein
MASADFCLMTPIVADRCAFVSGFRIRWRFHPFQDGPQSDFHNPNERQLRQISPDKNVNYRYTTAAFTLSPESWASLCCANSPGDWALYAVSVRRLIALHSGLPLPLVALACGSPYALLQPFSRCIAATDLAFGYRWTFPAVTLACASLFALLRTPPPGWIWTLPDNCVIMSDSTI